MKIIHPNLLLKKVLYRIKRDFNRRLTNYYYRKNFLKTYPSAQILMRQRNSQYSFTFRPKISIIMPVYRTKKQFLVEACNSVLNQTYDNWELCIVDDHSERQEITSYITKLATNNIRIKYISRKKRGHISKATNSGIKLSSGDYIGFVDHDDILWPNALYEIVSEINKFPDIDVFYTNEDKLEEDGKTHSDPFLKPEWNFYYIRTVNYICHFLVVRTLILNKVGGMKDQYIGAQDWDLILRLSRITKKIHHVPKILYSWRKSPDSTASEKHVRDVKKYAFTNQKKLLEDDLKARGMTGKVIPDIELGKWKILVSG